MQCASTQNSKVKLPTTVLVAVDAPQVREALVAMLGALERFRVVAEADTERRRSTPRGPSSAVGPDRTRAVRLRRLVGDQADSEPSAWRASWWPSGDAPTAGLAELVGAQDVRADGDSPRDLLSALQTAIALPVPSVSGAAEAEHHLLSDAHPMLEKPALVDF